MRSIVFVAAASFVSLVAAASVASAQRYKLTVDPGATDRHATVMSVVVPDLRPNPPRFLGTLTSADGKDRIRVQFDVEQDAAGNPVSTRATWIQPAMKGGKAKTYGLD